MKIIIRAKPGARENKIEKISDNEYVVSVKEKPIQGRANRAIEKLLAEHFNISPNKVVIVSGYASRNKIVEIINGSHS